MSHTAVNIHRFHGVARQVPRPGIPVVNVCFQSQNLRCFSFEIKSHFISFPRFFFKQTENGYLKSQKYVWTKVFDSPFTTGRPWDSSFRFIFSFMCALFSVTTENDFGRNHRMSTRNSKNYRKTGNFNAKRRSSLISFECQFYFMLFLVAHF